MKIYKLFLVLAGLAMLHGSRVLAQGANMSDPIQITTLYSGHYFDTRSTEGYGDDIGQPSEDVYYKFTLTRCPDSYFLYVRLRRGYLFKLAGLKGGSQDTTGCP